MLLLPTSQAPTFPCHTHTRYLLPVRVEWLQSTGPTTAIWIPCVSGGTECKETLGHAAHGLDQAGSCPPYPTPIRFEPHGPVPEVCIPQVDLTLCRNDSNDPPPSSPNQSLEPGLGVGNGRGRPMAEPCPHSSLPMPLAHGPTPSAWCTDP